MFACGLATKLGIVVRCNTSIIPEPIRYLLVAYFVKYVSLLATTLSVAVRCNTAIRPESIRWALITC